MSLLETRPNMSSYALTRKRASLYLVTEKLSYVVIRTLRKGQSQSKWKQVWVQYLAKDNSMDEEITSDEIMTDDEFEELLYWTLGGWDHA
jgi:hypothetical protein